MISIILNGCSNTTKTTPELMPTQPPLISQGSTITASESTASLSPCNLLNAEKLYEYLSDSTLIFSFEGGSCWVSDQWETKSVQVGVFQGRQAEQAIRWYAKQMIANWDKPDLISYFNQLLEDSKDISLVDFQTELIPFYERIDYRSERIFSVGDIAYWYTYPQATSNILEITQGNIYLRISINGLFPEEALPASQNIANQILPNLPEDFTIDFNFEMQSEVAYVTPTSPSADMIPSILSITADRTKIFFGDLCADETTNIQVRIDEKGLVNDVYLVYRLVSSQETNGNWVTRSMQRQEDGIYTYSLSAETNFPSYKVVNGANVEYAISILYSINSVFRSPTIRTITVNQCVMR